MENVPICQVCERMHEVGRGWTFCTGEKYHNICVGLRSVPEREEAFWQTRTQYRSDDFPNATRLMLHSVMAKLLDTKADPNLCTPPLHHYFVSGVAVHEMELNTPLHTVLGRLHRRAWYSLRGQTEAVP